ncbi:MAG: 3-phosphoshikimate 1-carboxyvinyltransferase [Actinomycetota bacterium]|nr:3-phosphoshikimate 1-carboxyvinyltransferase [Actinomycetota bacterium]
MADRTLQGTGDPILASVQVPGDKSLSHRALILAAIAEGDSVVTGLGPGEDVASTVRALSQLGVVVKGDEIRSPGIKGWHTPETPVDCGNSGTTMRLLAGALSTSSVRAELIGDASLTQRPMGRLAMPLRALGGIFATSTNGTSPLQVGGAEGPVGASVTIDLASAQVRTAFAFAALNAEGDSTIDSPPGFRDHTERWLASIGRGKWVAATRYQIHPGPIEPASYDIPGDPSSAAYLWALAAIRPGSQVMTPAISLNPGRLGFLQILEEMGAEVEAVVTGALGGDPVGDVVVRGRSLHGVVIEGPLVASALDELPLVAVVAAYGEGVTTVRGAAELRRKESDRIAATAAMITALQGGIETAPDGFSVVGTGFLAGGTVDSAGDHRIAMAAATAAAYADGPVTILDADVAAVSWPEFYATLEKTWS